MNWNSFVKILNQLKLSNNPVRVCGVLWFSANLLCYKYFMLPSVFVKATSRVLPPCFFLFPFAGPKLQRSASGKKNPVCLHMEKLAVCWHQCQSTHRND